MPLFDRATTSETHRERNSRWRGNAMTAAFLLALFAIIGFMVFIAIGAADVNGWYRP